MVVKVTMAHTTLIRPVFLAVLLAGVLVACGEAQEEEAIGADSSTTSSTSTTLLAAPLKPETTIPSVPPSNPKTAPTTVVDKAILDLVTRTKVSPDDVTVVLDEAVTWPDGSLGCPQPDMSYTQALVDGSRVLLEVDDRLYIYHAGSDGEPFLCESDEAGGGYDFVPPPGFDE